MQTTNLKITPIVSNTINGGTLQLSPITINQDYCKEWNVDGNDYVCLTKNGELVNPSLYRTGMFGGKVKENYFLLLKYVEAIYDFDFIKKCYPKKTNKELELQRKHLDGCWCILDKNGVEKVVFDQFKHPYLVADSCIYSVDNNYYNIETGEFYGSSYSALQSNDFLFLNNAYDKDEAKRGVLKINKKTGTYELFPGK